MAVVWSRQVVYVIVNQALEAKTQLLDCQKLVVIAKIWIRPRPSCGPAKLRSSKGAQASIPIATQARWIGQCQVSASSVRTKSEWYLVASWTRELRKWGALLAIPQMNSTTTYPKSQKEKTTRARKSMKRQISKRSGSLEVWGLLKASIFPCLQGAKQKSSINLDLTSPPSASQKGFSLEWAISH